MQKITFKYLLWKVLICFLLQVMATAVCIPAVWVLKANDFENSLCALIYSIGAFVVFLALQYGIMKRSNLSNISKKDYLLGESIAYSVCVLIGTLILALCSGGLVPQGFPYYLAVFSCGYPLCYLTGNILLGALLQLVLFPVLLLALYALKKKKDPMLLGSKKLPLPKDALVVEERSEEEGSCEEDEEENAESDTLSEDEQ